jgi:hypothetical protein
MASLSSLIHGEKPKVAPFEETDPIEMLKKLLSGEITDWPQIQQLGELFQNTQFTQLANAIPGIREIFKLGGENVAQAQKNALSLQKGELPPEDIAAIFRTSAAQNLKSGQLFSGMGGANALRNVGLGTLEGQMKGEDLATSAGNAAQRWMQMAQSTMLPSSAYLYSPDWFTDFMAKQAADKRNVKQFKYNVDAAPDPQWADRAKMFASLLGSFAGPGGSSMGQYASGSYGQNFGGGGGGGGGSSYGGGYGGGGGGPSNNPGFFSNLMSGYRGEPTQGFGGFLGSVWPGHQSTPYLSGGMPSDVNPAATGHAVPYDPNYGPNSASYSPFNSTPSIWG